MASTVSYQVAVPLPDEVRASFVPHDALTAMLLWNRGISERTQIDAFVMPDYDAHLHDPFLMTDMERAVSRVLDAVRNDERIGIFSDYDCDGIPGGVLLHDLFTEIGYENFENYIPHRHEEGFGFSEAAVDTLNGHGVRLIVTVDCGTVDHGAIARANAAGIDVIVTDHHEPNGVLPDAYALLNPKRDKAYPFRELCGAGVAWKLAVAVLTRGRETGAIDVREGWEKWLLDMVGIATIADRVPLRGENRVLAHYGLTVLRRSRRPGLQQLLRKARIDQRRLTEDDIGFTIGPRINAASRMDTPEDAFKLLATKSEADAGAHVLHLERLNNERKGVVASMSKEIKKRIEQLAELPTVIVMGNPEWRPALVGLAANSLVETYNRPVFLWGRDGQGMLKGSCRSDGVVSVIDLMNNAKDAFLEYGGHHASGGFTVVDDKIHHLAEALVHAYDSHILETSKEEAAPIRTIDADLTLSDIAAPLVRTLRTLAPFGDGNAKPVFRFQNVVPLRVETFGKAKEHTKILFALPYGTIEAIAFYRTPETFDVTPEAGKPHTLIAHVEESFFMNRHQTRLRIIAIC